VLLVQNVPSGRTLIFARQRQSLKDWSDFPNFLQFWSGAILSAAMHRAPQVLAVFQSTFLSRQERLEADKPLEQGMTGVAG
jgi:hypothetical protein